jgi:antitoxin component of MazEF toxin-antitoxin module
MKRSLVQVGSSLAVTLPVDVVQAFGLRKGQDVDLTIHPMSGAITIRPGVAWFEHGQVSADFRTLADEVLERRAGLLKKRATK